MSDYWRSFWENSDNIKRENEMSQVLRITETGFMDNEICDRLVSYIEVNLKINEESVVADLCCGNGLITIPLAKKSKSVTAVDISDFLLNKLRNNIDKEKITNITILHSDIGSVTLPEDSFTHMIWEAGIQYFTEREVLLIFSNLLSALKSGASFFIGDIPDKCKLWEYANTVEYEKIFFDRLKSNQPGIGTWFEYDYLEKMARYVGFSKIRRMEQSDWQPYSKHRFDMMLVK